MKPYYEHCGIAIFHADCKEIEFSGAVMLTDPPYGISYKSGARRGSTLSMSIIGDEDTSLRDEILKRWTPRPALVFGSWKMPRPAGTHTRLIWDTKGALGMGNLSIPWKPSDQEIYVIGKGFIGRRDSNVISVAPVQSTAANGRQHPHEKPVSLLRLLLEKCPPGTMVDPFCGSGSALVAAKISGRPAVGIEIEERYCEIAARRLSQEVFAL